MRCPKCQSGHVKSFSAWYTSGTSAIDARTRGVAALYSVRTKGTVQTGLAQIASPPTNWHYFKPTLAFLGAGTLGIPILVAVLPHLTGGGLHSLETLFFPGIVAVLACIPIVWLSIAFHNCFVLPSKMKAWESEWMCGSCQTTFRIAQTGPTP